MAFQHDPEYILTGIINQVNSSTSHAFYVHSSRNRPIMIKYVLTGIINKVNSSTSHAFYVYSLRNRPIMIIFYW